MPELFARDVVVVGLDDDACARADGQEVAEILARVVARGAEACEAEARLVLRVEAVEVAALQLKVGGARHVADDDELPAALAGAFGQRGEHAVGRGDGGDDEGDAVRHAASSCSSGATACPREKRARKRRQRLTKASLSTLLLTLSLAAR